MATSGGELRRDLFDEMRGEIWSRPRPYNTVWCSVVLSRRIRLLWNQ
jgi:hypothetical protein